MVHIGHGLPPLDLFQQGLRASDTIYFAAHAACQRRTSTQLGGVLPFIEEDDDSDASSPFLASEDESAGTVSAEEDSDEEDGSDM